MNRFISAISIIGIATVTSMTAGLPTSAIAQTLNSGEVEMTATVGTFCIFEHQLNGILGVPVNDLSQLSSTEEANGIASQDGTSGSIDVTCNDPSTRISISSVSETNTTGARLQEYETKVSGLGMDLVSLDGAASNAVAVGSTNTETLTVDLDADYNNNLSAGDYTYTVNLVANP